MKRVLAWIGAALFGFTLGAGTALLAPEAGRRLSEGRIGDWAYERAGDAGPYARATSARHGLMALSGAEALTFTLDRDEHGLPLQETCIYELAGEPISARFWSITLYAPDSSLPRNSDHAASIDAARVDAGARGRWIARIAPVRGEALNWISSREARRGFSLTLRIYNPRGDFIADAVTLPVVRTLSCPGVSS